MRVERRYVFDKRAAAPASPSAAVIGLEGASKLARCSMHTIRHAVKLGDLTPVVNREENGMMTFRTADIHEWAKRKRLIF